MIKRITSFFNQLFKPTVVVQKVIPKENLTKDDKLNIIRQFLKKRHETNKSRSKRNKSTDQI